ncbi:amino acid adenylation domain-containing protein [Streptomyces sp. NPDC059496]|uniref:amino acid adenylation domain-containing protein n=1 Tax=Streptomyces sp. NPDC059496 TaxID=3346851 RepID=UPI003695D8F2
MTATLELIRRRAVEEPGRPALRTAWEVVDYATLWEHAERTAGALVNRGVRPGDIVAVCLPARPDAVVALLGCRLAGAAYLPIDTATPAERRRILLSHSRATALITADPATYASVPATAVVLTPDDCRSGRRVDATDPGTGPAYVIYTSGSTGTPKGVVVGEPALDGHTAAVAQLLGLTDRDTVLQFASLAFDVAQEEIWPTLSVGGTVAFHEGGVPDAHGLAATAEALGVTVLQLPTAYWRMLCAELSGEATPAFTRVRTVVIGGESATATDARTHRHTPFAHATLVNGYGPTETVVTATAYVAAPSEPLPARGGLPIGGPVGERLLYVLDEGMRPVGEGEPGELWIGGPLLATGYLHDPERTEESFRPDPFAGDPEARMYRTGDLVRSHPAGGGLEFLGRADNQVKVRGHRVELDEVDRHLLETPSVTAGISFTLEDGGSGPLLAAAVARTPEGPQPDLVREDLRRRVPGYLVPGRIVILDQLPLTLSGKIDRRATAKAAEALLAATAEPAPQAAGDSSHVETVTALLRELLQNPGFGPDDDFLFHGGDSLMAMRLCARLRSETLPLRPGDFLLGRTARAAVRHAEDRSAPGDRPVVAEEASGPLDLLPAQRRWLSDGELPERDHFCLNALFTVASELDRIRLTGYAATLLRRHPALRTALREDGSVSLLDIDAASAVRAVDLAAVPARLRTQRLEEELAAAQRTMSLADGRVFGLLYAELGDGTARLLLTIHHFVLDGASMGLLAGDLEALLAGRPLAASTAGPREVGGALREWLAGSQAREDASRWALHCSHFTPLRPELAGPAGLSTLKTHRHRLSASDTRLVLHDLPRAGIAPHDFVLGALVGALAVWSGDPVHGVDVYAHSRDVVVQDLDLSRTVAYVQSTFPAVLRRHGAGLAAMRQTLAALAGLPERRYGFDALRFASPDPAERDALRRVPRPTVRLNFRGHLLRLEQPPAGAVLQPAHESFGPHRSPLQSERYTVMAEGDIVDGELELGLRYSTGHWAQERIEALGDALEQVVAEILADVGQTALDPVAGGAR